MPTDAGKGPVSRPGANPRRHQPLAIPAIAVAAGVVLASLAGAGTGPWAGVTVVLVALGCLAQMAGGHWRRASTACLLLAWGAVGGLLFLVRDGGVEGDLAPLGGQAVTLAGRVDAIPSRGVSAWRVPLAVEAARVGGRWRPARGRVVLVWRMPHVPAAGTSVPAPQSPWAYGQRLLASGRLERPEGAANPGGFDYRRYLRGQGVGFILRLKAPGDGWVTGSWRPLGAARATGAMALAASLRERLVAVMNNTLPPREAGLLKGIVLGERADMPAEVADAFQDTGLTHILSVSGFHVAFVGGALLAMGNLLRLPQRGVVALTLPVLALYALLSGAAPPVVRSALMFAAYLVGRQMGRGGGGVNSLALAFLLIVLPRPGALLESGFQLSFAATLGLIVLAPPLARGLTVRLGPLPGLPPWVALGLGVTIAAQAASLPLLLRYFGAVSLASLPANLVAVPLSAAAVVLGFAGAVAGLVWLPAAWFIHRFAGLSVDLMEVMSIWFASWPGASITLPPPSLAGAAAYYGGLAAGLFLYSVKDGAPARWRPRLAWAAVALGLLALLFWRPEPGRWPLEMAFLHVGQGAAVVARLPGGRVLVVDGGPPPRPRAGSGRAGPRGELAAYLSYLGVRRVDWLVATHGDADHIGGLIPVAAGFRVGEFWTTPFPGEETATWHRLGEVVGQQGAVVRHPRAGQTFTLAPGVHLEVWNPGRRPMEGTPADENNNCLVLRLTFGRLAVLLPADLEEEGERALLEARVPVRADILQAGHHGSEASSSLPFLRAVAPRLAVVQVGPNGYGLPAGGALRRLRLAGAAPWRTDRGGAVLVRSDGRRVVVAAGPRRLAFQARGHVQWRRGVGP